MNYILSFGLMTIMIIIGMLYGVLFHGVVMPIFNGQLLHCLLIGAAFGFTNFFVVSFFYRKYSGLKNTNWLLKANLRTDKLTGLLNRRVFEEDLEKLDNTTVYSVIFIDIDNFREYNNKYGHQIGDMILKRAGLSIKQSVRENDLAYRYGGEEFVLILPDSNKEEAFKVAERIRESIIKQDLSPYPSISISLGISNYPEDGQNISDIINAGDMALLAAKASGKNKSVVYDESSFMN